MLSRLIKAVAVGYYLGTRQGRDGLQKALDSVAAPAVDRMGGKSGRSKSALLGSVMDEVPERRHARHAAAAA